MDSFDHPPTPTKGKSKRKRVERESPDSTVDDTFNAVGGTRRANHFRVTVGFMAIHKLRRTTCGHDFSDNASYHLNARRVIHCPQPTGPVLD